MRPEYRTGSKFIAALAMACAGFGLPAAVAQTPSPASAAAAAPAPTPAPKARGILTIQREGQPDSALTLADLKALPQSAIVTGTPWQDGKSRFEGVPMSELFKRLGVKDGAVTVSALDGYVADFPFEEAQRFNVILAFRKDGKELTIREKGPLFIIYDYDGAKSTIGEPQLSRSVWQVSAIRIR